MDWSWSPTSYAMDGCAYFYNPNFETLLFTVSKSRGKIQKQKGI
jgi:hypothetical protein